MKPRTPGGPAGASAGPPSLFLFMFTREPERIYAAKRRRRWSRWRETVANRACGPRSRLITAIAGCPRRSVRWGPARRSPPQGALPLNEHSTRRAGCLSKPTEGGARCIRTLDNQMTFDQTRSPYFPAEQKNKLRRCSTSPAKTFALPNQMHHRCLIVNRALLAWTAEPFRVSRPEAAGLP
jgi:hypothetical protein